MRKGEHINDVMAIIYANLLNLTLERLIYAIKNVGKCYQYDVFDLNQMSFRQTQSCRPTYNIMRMFCCCRPLGKNSAYVRQEMKEWVKLALGDNNPHIALRNILERSQGKFDFYKDSHHFSLKFLLIKELCNEQLKVGCAMTERDYNIDGVYVDTDFNGQVQEYTWYWLSTMGCTPALRHDC